MFHSDSRVPGERAPVGVLERFGGSGGSGTCPFGHEFTGCEATGLREGAELGGDFGGEPQAQGGQVFGGKPA